MAEQERRLFTSDQLKKNSLKRSLPLNPDVKYAAEALVMLSRDAYRKRPKIVIKNKDEDANGCFRLPTKSVLDHKLPSMDERDAKNPLFLSTGKTEPNPRNNSEFWTIKKVLYKSDVNGNNRLMLGASLVMNNIVSAMTPDMARKCTTSEGQEFAVHDMDDSTAHCLILKKHTQSSQSFVFIGKWCANFVRRRNLGVGDEVGLAWDADNCRFLFKVLNRAYEVHQG